MGIKMGVIGIGQFGSGFAQLFAAHPMVDEFYICDMDEGRIKAMLEHAVVSRKANPSRCTTDMAEFLKYDLDAVAVMTQPWLHAPQCIEVLKSGKSVYSAVPIISLPDDDETLEWCSRLLETVKITGREYMMGETSYYRAGAMYSMRQAKKGAFGKIYYTEGEYLHGYDHPGSDLRPTIARRMSSASAAGWKEKLIGYRARGKFENPMDYPTHSVIGPLAVTGSHALRASCIGRQPMSQDPYWEDTNHNFSNMTALFELADESVMRILEHRETVLNRETFRFYGTEGAYENGTWIHKDKDNTRDVLTDEQMRDPLPVDVVNAFLEAQGGINAYGGHGGSHAYLVHEFVMSVLENRKPTVDVKLAVDAMCCGVAARQSAARDGEWVKVPNLS